MQRIPASADTLRYDTKQAGHAITKFLQEAQGIAIDPVFLTTAVRHCFVARRTEPEFVDVQVQIQDVLGRLGVKASSYQPGAGGHVVEKIIDQEPIEPFLHRRS